MKDGVHCAAIKWQWWCILWLHYNSIEILNFQKKALYCKAVGTQNSFSLFFVEEGKI